MATVVRLSVVSTKILLVKETCQRRLNQYAGSSRAQVLLLPSVLLLLSSCAVSEEVRRIERVKNVEQQQLASRSEGLTGEQIFVRSCNTCHPGGKAGVGPSLSVLNERFPTDKELGKFIRSGKGLMPPQPSTVLNDQELTSLMAYLRSNSICAPRTEAIPGQQSRSIQQNQ